MTGTAQVLQIASALMRRGTDVLMVLQKGPEDPEAHWALAGGAVGWYALSGDYAWAMAACVSGFSGSLVAVALETVVMLRSPLAALGRVSALFEAAGQLSSRCSSWGWRKTSSGHRASS